MVYPNSILSPLLALILCIAGTTTVSVLGDSTGTHIGKCKYQFSDNSSIIDLNPLASHDSAKWLLRVPVTKDKFEYFFSPCWPMDKYTEGENCKSAVACQHGINGNLYYNLGDLDTEQFNVVNSRLILSYSGVTEGDNRTSLITLVCDKTATKPSFTFDGQLGQPLRYTFTLTSSACCPIAVGGISLGTVLCIVFIVVLVVYIVGGVLFNKFARGATGAEVIPNRAFWADLPKLILEGFQFTGAKISGCFSRDSQYDQI